MFNSTKLITREGHKFLINNIFKMKGTGWLAEDIDFFNVVSC